MTSKATIGSAAKERDGLNPKDFVFIAVFGILLFLVFMVFSIIFSANANLCWFTHTVGALFAGTVFMYHGYTEADVNSIIPPGHNDPYSGFPGYRSTRCGVKKQEV